MPIPARVNLTPDEDDLMSCNDLYYAFDALITTDGFTGDNIMKPRGQTTLFWDWTIVKIGRHVIPSPIHTISDTESELFDHMDRPVQMDNAECACVTAYFYLDMLFRFAAQWDQLRQKIAPTHVLLIQDGIKWANRVSSSERAIIMSALKRQMSEKGHQVLN